MKDFLNTHFDMLAVVVVAILLLTAYVVLLINGIDNKAIELTTVSAVSGAIGMGTKKTRSVEVTGDETKVEVGK